MNPCDTIMRSIGADGRQLAALFLSDDQLVLRLGNNIKTESTKKLYVVCSTEDLTIVTQGKDYEYLGMEIDFELKIVVALNQFDFTK